MNAITPGLVARPDPHDPYAPLLEQVDTRGWKSFWCNGAGTYLIKQGPGILWSVLSSINGGNNTFLRIYDGVDASGDPVFPSVVIGTTAITYYALGIRFKRGITVVNGSTLGVPKSLTVVYI